MSVNPLGVYQEVAAATLSGRQLEAHVLNKAAAQLIYAKNNWEAEDHEKVLDDALKFNQNVWSFFQAELCAPENPLPSEIKSNLLTLSLYVDKRTFDVMAFPVPEKLDVLISINQNLAAGLLSDGGGV